MAWDAPPKAPNDPLLSADWNAMVADIKGRPRGATLVVAANDSLDKAHADYVCDGVADQAEINAALNALPAGGGKVLLLEGTYNLSDYLAVAKNNVIIEGQGFSTKITSASNINMLIIAGYDDITIRDLFIQGNDDTSPTCRGIYIAGGSIRITIDNCKLDEFFYGVLVLTGVNENITITNSTLSNCRRHVYIGNATFYKITNCHFEAGVGTDGAVYMYSNHGLVDCCTFNATATGIIMNAIGCEAIGNKMYGNSSYCISVTGYGNKIIGNTFNANTSTTTAIRSTVNNTTISGNYIKDVRGHAIEIIGGDDNVISGNIILNCGIDANNTYSGIRVSGTSTYNCINGNRILNSAANKPKYCIEEAAAVDDWNVCTGNICVSAATANILNSGVNSVFANNIAP